jgi:hypothetical protein
MIKIRGRRRTQLVQIMSLQNSNPINKYVTSYSVLMLLFHLYLGLPSWCFLRDLLTRIMCATFTSPVRPHTRPFTPAYQLGASRKHHESFTTFHNLYPVPVRALISLYQTQPTNSLIYYFSCCSTMHFDKYQSFLWPTNAHFINTKMLKLTIKTFV